MTLQSIGWTPILQTAFDQLADSRLVPARVARQDRTRYRLLAATGEFPARLPRRFHDHSAPLGVPAVGDWVAATPEPMEGPWTIQALLPRRTAFVRAAAGRATAHQVVAANVDVVLLVAGLDGDFNPRRLERYLALAAESGAAPVVVLNKADACPDLPGRLREARAVAGDVPVLAVSAHAGTGLDALRLHLGPGRTVALLGSSGVGKSSLVNRLLGEERMPTQEVREHDSHGRHTTTHRALIPLPGGGVLLDTPGMRELPMSGDGDGLRSAFEEIERLALACRFRDCAHEREPGCAVRAEVEAGALDPARLAGYRKLAREAAYNARRLSEARGREERRRGREGGRITRNALADKARRRRGLDGNW